jgi:serine/threonine protein kinase
MGSVYRVTHLRLGKAFALKRMHESLSDDPSLRDLFYREGRLASRLSHPNIVSVIDFGEDRRLGAFMVMELVEGLALSEQIRSPMPVRRATEILLQLAEALHYSHENGVIHCDVKPENVLLTHVSGRREWTAKLLDFGLAHLQRATDFAAGVVRGTPEYMAPERFLGEAPHGSMDIYSLGVLAYAMFSGKVPFGPSGDSVLHSHLHKTPVPLSRVCPEPIDDRLESFVMRMLAKDPLDRHPTMAAVIFELKTVIDMLGFKAQRARRRSTNRIGAQNEVARHSRRALELFPMPAALVDGDGTIRVANPAMVKFLGRADRIEGTSIFDPMLDDVYPQLSADMRYAHITKADYRRKLPVCGRDGETMTLNMHIVPGDASSREVLLFIMPQDRG